MPDMLHDIEPGPPKSTDLRADVAALTERVRKVENRTTTLKDRIDRTQGWHRQRAIELDNLTYQVRCHIRADRERHRALRKRPAPTPPPADAPDKAAKWKALSDAIRDREAGNEWSWLQAQEQDDLVKVIVAKAIELNLAAPVDRAVVTDDTISAIYGDFHLHRYSTMTTTTPESFRAFGEVLRRHLRAASAEADTEGENQ